MDDRSLIALTIKETAAVHATPRLCWPLSFFSIHQLDEIRIHRGIPATFDRIGHAGIGRRSPNTKGVVRRRNLSAKATKIPAANRYTLRFAPGQLPPVNAFWSLTMYELPASLLVANPINRYLINSPMLPQLKRDADGGLTLLIQNESPGKDKEANWLPAPKGPFAMYMRLYWPKEEALEGKWTAPKLKKAE